MIYLDNAATSRPKPPEVIHAMTSFMTDVCANSGRSSHRLAVQASRIVYEAREAVAELFNVPDPLQIVFTLNATESINLALKGLLKPGDHAITSSMEHNSVMRPLRFLEHQGIELTVVKCSSNGIIDHVDVRKSIKKNTKLIILNHASNVIGSIQPAEELGLLAREYGLLFMLDAAQTAGAYPIDAQRLNIDILVFSGHKSLLGPPGTGGLYIRQGVDIIPLKQGGTGSRSEEEYQPDFLPDKHESGTPNLPGIAGLGAGVRFIIQEKESIRKKEIELTQEIINGLASIPGVKVYGGLKAEQRVGVISFNIENMSPSEVGFRLDYEYEIMCRVGLHCAPVAHRTIGTFPDGTVRLSVGIFNTKGEVDMVISAVRDISLT